MSQPLRIMILGDHASQRAIVVSLFRRLGHAALEATHAIEALAILESVGGVDVVLCDLSMSDMDGLEFLQHAAQRGWLHGVIVSGHQPPGINQALQQFTRLLGVRLLGHVDKPTTLNQLEGLLHRHLRDGGIAPEVSPALPLFTPTQVCEALAAGQLHAYYQPKFSLWTQEMVGVEVLSRWQHPLYGLLPAMAFMPVLERSGMLDDLLFAQMHQALTLQQHVRASDMALNLAFNLHAQQLAQGGLSRKIEDVMATFKVPHASVTFELTESGLLDASASSLACLMRLRLLGCNLSLDDFGAGYSSLQRLCQLPFNEIKLDAEFVRGMTADPRCRAVIHSTLALGDSLGMTVVVEGIETREQQRQLLAMGCRVGQGYVYARAMSGEQLLWRLQNVA
ncbi:EAL domain-containing response regulator [Pseudomonas sp. 58 R 3]|uniref:EAL domain-containing response regulator n=1 Tax=Pseudomonas sp. 58 R 3 TaxID=1844108 RepID=UPI001EFA43C9|nr:EAL domain-containing response regulator [Pseudomonas sp. 58 R 3]